VRQVHSIRVHRRQRRRDGVVNSSVVRLYRTILALLRVVIDEFRARVKTPCPDVRRCDLRNPALCPAIYRLAPHPSRSWQKSYRKSELSLEPNHSFCGSTTFWRGTGTFRWNIQRYSPFALRTRVSYWKISPVVRQSRHLVKIPPTFSG
jgi:hypothetical protein